MCYAIPGRVETIGGGYVTVDYFGEKKKAVNELDSVCVGDYIYAQGGFVIDRIEKNRAESILSVWKETFFELQEVDLRLSGIKPDGSPLNKTTTRILDKALEGRRLKREELLYLLRLETPEEKTYLYKAGNFLRQKNLSNSCCIHGILEFSNRCRRNCGYCGISVHNRNAERYSMDSGRILEAARSAVEDYGFKALVLQSGEISDEYADEVAEAIRAIRKELNTLIFISCGEIGEPNLKKFYEAGARGLLLRFETANPDLYRKLHPGYELKTRIRHLKTAWEIGYLIITGALIGVPGQTAEDQLDDILLTKELHAEMYSFGPFIPHPETPLKSHRSPPADEVLKTLAVARIVDPENAKILITTAFETIDSSAVRNGLLAGGNSLMLNVTPPEYRDKYVIYPDRAHSRDNIREQIEHSLGLLHGLGRAPTDLGISN